MDEIHVNLGERSYTIYIGFSHLQRLPHFLKNVNTFDRVLVVSNTTVGELYADQLIDLLNDGGFAPELLLLPDGERYKDITTVRTIWDLLVENNFPRQTTLIALGGGVIGDMAGFAAATYMRGIPYVQMPTSLLAMVDASVGGKVAVNHPVSKNLIGSFYQPRLVFINLEYLKTLPPEEMRAGFAEVIKYGIIRDAAFFEYLEKEVDTIYSLEPESLERVVATSCRIKADIVEQDERESGIRAILNFGHTIGHAVESLTRYRVFKHGEAVALGMVAAARIAERMGMLSADRVQRIQNLVARAALPHRFKDLEPGDILERVRKDKKVTGGRVRYILPQDLGKVIIADNVDPALVSEVLSTMKEENL